MDASPAQGMTLKVFPRPRVTSVTPRLGGVLGGGRVTVAGAFFGSTYSRGFHAAVYGNISVYPEPYAPNPQPSTLNPKP